MEKSVAPTQGSSATTAEPPATQAPATAAGASVVAGSTTSSSATPATTSNVESAIPAPVPQQTVSASKAFDAKAVTSFKKGLTFTIKSPDILKQSVLRIGYIQGGFLVESTTDLDSTMANCILKDVSSSFEVKVDQTFTMTKISAEGIVLTAVSSDGILNLEFTRGSKANQPPEWTIKELKEALGSAVEVSAIE